MDTINIKTLQQFLFMNDKLKGAFQLCFKKKLTGGYPCH